MDTTRYAKPRPCLPSLQRSRSMDRVVAVIFNQRTLDEIGKRDAHVLSTIVRAASSSGHDQL